MCLPMILQVSKIRACLRYLMGMVVGQRPSGALITIPRCQESFNIPLDIKLL